MWSDAVPNLLIGLREGLEAGLIVSILVATVVRSGRRDQLPAVWAGVACAVALSLGAGAILTFGAADLPTTTQELIGGVLSVVAVALVTWMVFWMRRSARDLSSHLRTRTELALTVGPQVLLLTAFLAVAREGLEAALFLWSTTRTAGESAGPAMGAVIGFSLAVLVCWALYRRSLHLNLTRFFTWTGVGLIWVAAGVLAYGVRDLQGAGVLPSAQTMAFDLSSSIDASSWYARVVEGVLNLTPAMTVLQVFAYVAYLVPVLTVFLWKAGTTSESEPVAESADPAGDDLDELIDAAGQEDGELVGPRRRASPFVLIGAGVAVLSVVVSVAVITRVGPKQDAAATIEVGDTSCAAGWTAPSSGPATFTVHNGAAQPAEIYLTSNDRVRVFGEIEGLAPGTTRNLTVTIAPGAYQWHCALLNGTDSYSAPGEVTGPGVAEARSYVPVTQADLDTAVTTYRASVTALVAQLVVDTDALHLAVNGGDLTGARSAWLTAHLDYERLGAAYGTFGDFDAKINGRSDGLPLGSADPDFTGFGRLEADLWPPTDPPGSSALSVAPAAAGTVDQLTADVHDLAAALPAMTTEPGDLALRAHEILENSLQFELTALTDHGSHTNLATVRANIDGTAAVLDAIAPMLTTRDQPLLDTTRADLQGLAAMVDRYQTDGTWTGLDQLSLSQRQQINGATSHLLEELAPIPDLLELPPAPPAPPS